MKSGKFGFFGTVTAPQALSVANELAKGVLYVPHRGDALRAPEHTAIAYSSSTSRGFPWIEMDTSELSDGTLAAFHDATVDRITTSTGSVGSFNTAGYLALVIDSDNWFGGGFGNLSPQIVSSVLSSYLGSCIFVVDEKTGGGGIMVTTLQSAGVPTGQAMVGAQTYSDLAPAIAAGYAGLIASTPSQNTDPADAISNGVEFVAIDHLRGSAFITPWVASGVKVMCFTVQRKYDRDAMLAIGVTGFFSDDTEYLKADTPFSTTDNFAAQTWQPGMIAQNYKNSTASTDDGLDEPWRGRFVAPDKWGWTADNGTNLVRSVLQGWGCPIKSTPTANDFTIDMKITFGIPASGDQSRWGGVFIAADDRAYESTAGGTGGPSGYLFFMRKNGTIAISLSSNNQSTDTLLAQNTSGAAIADNTEVRFKVIVTPTSLTIQRLDGGGSVVQTVTSNDTTAGRRGGFFHLCRSRMPVLFRDITIT